MGTDLQNFEDWYARILERLFPIRAAGFVITGIALPLLERYVRQKIRLAASKRLTNEFHTDVLRLVPDFQNLATVKAFWRRQLAQRNQVSGRAGVWAGRFPAGRCRVKIILHT